MAEERGKQLELEAKAKAENQDNQDAPEAPETNDTK